MGHPYHRLVPILFVTAALAACGGGDDGPGTEGVAAGGGTNTGSPGTVVADSGSVKAPYQISQAPRYALLSIGARSRRSTARFRCRPERDQGDQR